MAVNFRYLDYHLLVFYLAPANRRKVHETRENRGDAFTALGSRCCVRRRVSILRTNCYKQGRYPGKRASVFFGIQLFGHENLRCSVASGRFCFFFWLLPAHRCFIAQIVPALITSRAPQEPQLCRPAGQRINVGGQVTTQARRRRHHERHTTLNSNGTINSTGSCRRWTTAANIPISRSQHRFDRRRSRPMSFRVHTANTGPWRSRTRTARDGWRPGHRLGGHHVLSPEHAHQSGRTVTISASAKTPSARGSNGMVFNAGLIAATLPLGHAHGTRQLIPYGKKKRVTLRTPHVSGRDRHRDRCRQRSPGRLSP